MSSSLFANVLQQNKPPPKRREAYAADGGGGGGDPLSGVPDNTTDPRAVTESKYGRNVRGQVGKSGRGSSRRVAPVNGSPDKYNGVMPQSTPERMMGNAPLEVDDLADLTGGTGGNEAVVAQARRGRGRDDGASAQSPTAARKGRGQMVQASEPGTPDKYSDRSAPGGVPGGLPNMRGGVTDVEHEIENAREKHAQESALANELLRRQIEFEKNASDKMNGFIDRHGFTWYHVLMILIINNIIVVILGASVSSGIMSASFSLLGVVQADSLYAIQAGEQNVVVESVHGPSAVTVRSAGGGTNDKPMDSRIVLEEGETDAADALIFSSGGAVTTRRSALQLQPAAAMNLVLQPTSGGVVMALSDVGVTGQLDVGGDIVASGAFAVDPATNIVSVGGFGQDPQNASLSVSGGVTATGLVELPDPSAGLSVAGETQLRGGASVDGSIVLAGSMAVVEQTGAGRRLQGADDELMRIDADGAIFTQANATVLGYANLREMVLDGTANLLSNTILGDSPFDEVIAKATASFESNVQFQANTLLGNEDTDIIDVSGTAMFHEQVVIGDAPAPSPTAATCDAELCVWSATEMHNDVDMSGDVRMTGSVQIGQPGEVMNFLADMNIGQVTPFGPMAGGVWSSGDNQMLTFKSETGDFYTKGGIDIKKGTKLHCWGGSQDAFPGEASPLMNDGQCDALDVSGNSVFRNPTTFVMGPMNDYSGLYPWTTPGTTLPPAATIRGPKRGSGVYGNALDVTGNTRVSGDVEIYGAGTLDGPLTITSPAAAGALTVNGDVNLGESGTVPADLLKVYSETEFLQPAEAKRDFTISGSNFFVLSDTKYMASAGSAELLTIEHGTGNLYTAGTMTVDGKTTLEETEVVGTATLLGDVTIGDGQTNTLSVQATTTFSSPVILGESVSDVVTVWGSATFQEALTAKRAFWAQDNVVLGDTGMDQLVVNAEAQFRTQVMAMGAVTLGDDAMDTVVINGQVAVRLGLENKLTIDPSTGTLATQGQLSVNDQADLNAAVTLGSGSADAITIRGESSFSAPVTLGDDSNDAIHIIGRATLDAPTLLEATAELTVLSDITLGAADGSSSLDVRSDLDVAQAVNVEGGVTVQGQVNAYSRIAVKDSLEVPQVALEATGDITATNGITADTGTVRELTVSELSTLEGGIEVGQSTALFPGMTGMLNCFGNADFRGNAIIAGMVDVTGVSELRDDVTVDPGATLTALGDVSLGPTTVTGAATFDGDATFAESVTLGDSVGNDGIAINGRLDVMHNGAPMLSAYPTGVNNFPNTGDVLAAGVTVHGDLTIAQATDAQTIRVHGDAVFDADMTLGHDGTDITAHGDLTVTSDVVFGNLNNVPPKTLTVHGDVTLESRLFVNSDVSITGLTVSGSADFQSGANVDGALNLDGTTTVLGLVELYTAAQDAGGELTMRMRSSDGYLFAAGNMEIQGMAVIGDDITDRLQLTGRLTVESGVAGDPLTFKADPDTGLININGVTFDVQAEMMLHNNFYIKNPVTSNTMFSIRSDTGDTVVQGDFSVMGELITGDKPLRISTLYADVILGGGGACDHTDYAGEEVLTEASCNGVGTCSDPAGAPSQSQCEGLAVPGTWTSAGAVWTPSESGVTIEGVQFRDGGFVMAKADVINELTLGMGVLVEGVKMKHGTMTIQGQNAGVNPKGEHDLATIINTAHSWDMDGTVTSMVFMQYFEHTSGNVLDHHAADSGKIKVGTETDWSENGATRDAFMLFETVYHGAPLERLRMASNGDITFTNTAPDGSPPASKFFFEAATGDTAIQGHVSVGAVPGKRKLEVTSTDEDAVASISSGAGNGKTGRLLITGDYAETRLVAAESEDARIVMMDEREKGFAWSRSEAGNVLNLDRIRRGDNDVVNVAGGSMEVIAAADGDFADIRVGDRILMNVDDDCVNGVAKACLFGKTESREVTALRPDEGATDKVIVNAPFSANAIIARAYYIARRITTVEDDNTMTFGGAKASGNKKFSVRSSDSAATLQVTAATARAMGAVKVTGDDDTELRALAGQNRNARLELDELGSCTDPNDETTCTGGKGYTFWRGGAQDNEMDLYRTFVSTNYLVLQGGMNVLNAFGADQFDDLTVGDYIIVLVSGVEELRKVTALAGGTVPPTPGNYPNVVTLDSAFDADTSVSQVSYKVARPVMSVTDENNVMYGDTTGEKLFTLKSLDAAVQHVVQAAGENEALITLSSELNTAIELQSGRNDDARIKLRDSDRGLGYTIARKDEGNVLAFDNTIPGPGGTVSIVRSQTTAISSGALFASVNVGDHLIVSWEGVEYTRKITAVDVSASPHELTIDLRISDSFDIVAAPFSIGQRVLEFSSKDDVVIGGNAGPKTLVFQSTDSAANMAITAAGVNNEGVLSIAADDAVSVALKGGADQDVRVELADASLAGYRLTRTSTDNDLFLDRTYAGPGGTIDVGANSPTVTAANIGDFTDTVKVGDTVIVYVTCDATADCGTEQRRTIQAVAVNGGSLTVDSPFSTDTAITAAPFQVARKIISVDNQDKVKIGGSGGDKTFTLESTDSNTVLEVISHADNAISKIDVNGDVAMIDINSGVGQNTKLKMRDHDIGTGYLISRDSRPYSCGLATDACAAVSLPTTQQTCRDAGPCIYTAEDAGAGIAESCVNSCNSFLLQRTEEGADTIRCTANSQLVYAEFDGQFAEVAAQDRITMIVNGVETTRTVVSVNHAVDPDRLTVDAIFHETETLENMAYVVERPIFTVPNENSVVIGGSTSSKTLSLSSTDEAAFFDVTANCPAGQTCNYESRITVASTTRSSSVVQSGLDTDAVLHLVSTAPRAHGFAFTRGSGLHNKLYLDRTAQGPGGTITCAAGETRVIARNDGDFDHIRIGDKLVVEIDGVEYSSLVFSLELLEEPDELHVTLAFHPTVSITDHFYQRYRTVMTVEDDDIVVFGGNKGSKSLALTSTDSTADFTLTSAGANMEANLNVVSGDDYSNLRIESAGDKDSRMYLVDQGNTGFLFRKAQGTENALKGFSFLDSDPNHPVDTDPIVKEGFDFSGSANSLTLERTIAIARPEATVDVLQSAAKLTASADGEFANIRAGDFVTLIIDGVEVQRTVRMMTLTADPDILDVDSAYSSTQDIVGASYFVTRPLVAFDDYNSLLIGGTMTAAQVDIISTHDSATLKVEASNSPENQPDSTGQYGHADIQIVSDAVSTLGIYTQSEGAYGIGGDSRLKLKDQEQKKGYMLTRLDEGVAGANKFINFRTELGPGLKMYCAATGTTVISSNAVNAFLDVHPGDYIMALVDGVEVIRKVVSVDTSVTTNSLEVDRPFSDVTNLQETYFDLMRPVITLTDDNNFLYGGTSDSKSFTIESTDDSARMSIKAKGNNNRADVWVTADDIIDVDLKGGADKDIRLKLRDATKGFVITRDGTNTDLVFDRWLKGSDPISCSAGDTTVSAATSGGFANVAVGDRIVVEVNGEEETRLVESVVPGVGVVDYLTVDSQFSGSTAVTAADFYISRRALTADDTTFQVFGTNGGKVMNLVSLDDRIDVKFQAGADLDPATDHPAQMTLQSEHMSTLSIHAGSNYDAKLKLEDYKSEKGYTFIRGESSVNQLGLDRTEKGSGTVSCTAAEAFVTSSGTFFSQYNKGDYIAVVIDGLEQVRRIQAIVNPSRIEMSSMFDGSLTLTDVEYTIKRRVLTVETDDHITLGGKSGEYNSGDKVVDVLSSDASARLNVNGAGDRALISLDGDDATITVSGGDGTGVGHAGLALRSLASGSTTQYQGYSMTRLTAERPGTAAAADRTAANVLQLDRVTEGPGGTITVSSSSGGAASAGGGLFVHACSTCDGAFASLQVGDKLVIELPAVGTAPPVSVARTVTCIMDGRDGNGCGAASTDNGSPDYLTVDVTFSGSATLEDVPYHVQRKVLSFTDDHTATYGDSPGDKSVSVTSTAGSSSLVVRAAGDNKDGQMTLGSVKADAGVKLVAGTMQEARLSLNSAGAGDAAYFGLGRGFTLTRGADTARSNANLNVLSLYHTAPGPGTTVTVAAGSTTVTATNTGGTSFNDFTAGEHISIMVSCEGTSEETDAVTGAAKVCDLDATTDGGATCWTGCSGQTFTRKIVSINTAAQTLVVDLSFSATVAYTDVPYEVGKKALAVEDDGETVRIGGAFIDEDATDLATTDVKVKGDVTLSGLLAVKSQILDAQAAITIESSHVIIKAVAGVQANDCTIVAPESGSRAAGTVLWIENNDDDDVGGSTMTSCPAQSRCTYLLDGDGVYQVYAQVDMY